MESDTKFYSSTKKGGKDEEQQEDEENYNDVKQKITEAFPPSKSYKNILSLDFSAKKFNLIDLNELETSLDYRQMFTNITSLDATRNSLSMLRLKGYNSLEKIKACDNIISKVELNLVKLKRLDLSVNLIGKIFELNSIPNLEELCLNKNVITRISYEDFKPVKSSLAILELEQNKIEFQNAKEFFEFFETFGRNMKKLKSLLISGNTFSNSDVYKDYAFYIIHTCRYLKILNSKTIDSLDSEETIINISNLKKKIIEKEKSSDKSLPILKSNLKEVSLNDKKSESERSQKTKGTKGGEANIVSLSYINSQLAKYTTFGKLSSATFQELRDMVEEFIKDGRMALNSGENFEDTESDEFECLLEYCNILIDTTQSIEKDLYFLISSFITIKNGKFAEKTMLYLKQRINPEKAKDIEDVLLKSIVEYVTREDPVKLLPSVLRSIEPFVIDNKPPTVVKLIIMQLIKVVESFKNVKLLNIKSNEDNRKKEIYLVNIRLISLASNFKEYAYYILNDDNIQFQKIIQKQIEDLLSKDEDAILNDKKVIEILNNLLQIICKICKVETSDDNNINNKDRVYNLNIIAITSSGLKDKVEQSIVKKLQDFIKNNGYFGVKGESTIKEINYSKKIILATLFKCLGSMLFRSQDLYKYIISPSSTALKIMNVLIQTDINDPIILAAACEFTLFILENKNMKNNLENAFYKTIANLYNLRYVLPYMQQDRIEYKRACAIAESHGQNATNNGKAAEPAKMNSEIIQNMFISIAYLIEYFGKNAKKESPIKNFCAAVCNEMNDQNRDKILCDCISVPNDYVKKAIVDTLYSLDCAQLQEDEIKLLYKQVKNINLTGGLNDYIVSIIFIIISRCFAYFHTEKFFDKIEMNAEIVQLAFDLLLKNEESSAVYENESMQKSIVSRNLVVFLTNCSLYECLSSTFKEQRNILKMQKVLHYEELFVEESYNLPIEIEKSKSGRNLDNLVNCFNGEFQVTPYTYISLRILIHLADLLMNYPILIFTISDTDEYKEVSEALGTEVTRRDMERIRKEGLSFKAIIEEKNKIYNGKNKNYLILSPVELIEQQQKFVNLFPTILSFILGSSENKSKSYDHIWKDKFDENIDKLNYSTMNITSSLSKEQDYNSNFLANNNELNPHKQFNVKAHIYEKFIYNLRMEEYSTTDAATDNQTFYNNIMSDLIKYDRYGEYTAKSLRFSDEETPNNSYLRGLTIAVFLRCIYAILEHCSDKTIKDQMISLLYKGDNIKILAKLTDCTKLKDFNISSKFLIIMRHVLINSNLFLNDPNKKDRNKEITETEYLNKMAVMAYMITKMINIFKQDLKLEINDHKIFLSEISRCCALICNELQNLTFANEKIKEMTLESLISFDLILVFIKTVRDYMGEDSSSNNTNEEKSKKGSSSKAKEEDDSAIIAKIEKSNSNSNTNVQDNLVLNEMIATISNILSEYMAKCKSAEYKILEIFTKYYIFDKVKLRKTYLKELIEASKLSEMKSTIYKSIKLNVNFVTRVYLHEYVSGRSALKLMAVTSSSLEFLKVNDSDDERSDWYLKDFDKDKDYSIEITDIEVIISFEFLNRILVKTKKNMYSMFFTKMQTSIVLIDLLKVSNSNIKVYDQIPLFKLNEQKPEKTENKEKKSAKVLDQETYNTTNDANEKELSLLKNNNNNSFNNKDTIIVYCIIQISQFFDFLTNIFKKNEILTDGKIVFIKDKTLHIYMELINEWEKIPIKEIFRKAEQSEHIHSGISLYDFSNCFKFIADLNLDNCTTITVENVEEFNLKSKDGSRMEIKVLDDLSFIKLKKVFSSISSSVFIEKSVYDDIC